MKRKLIRLCLSAGCAVSVILMLSGPVFATHPLITDDTGTQGRGGFQLEVNGAYSSDRDDGVRTRTAELASSLTYGISDPLDIVFGVPYQYLKTEDAGGVTKSSGLSDLSVELKWRFYEKDGLGLALKPGVTLPTGDEEKGLGSGKPAYRLFFICTKELKPWTFHFNVGYTRNENILDERKNLWHISLASTIDVIKDLKIVGNAGIESNAARDSNNQPAFILGGLVYSLSGDFEVDFGVKAGLTKSETDYSVLAGLTRRF